jgi:hypothetical protein
MKQRRAVLKASVSLLLCSLLVLAWWLWTSAGKSTDFSVKELVDKIIASEKEIKDAQAQYVFFEPQTNMALSYAEWGYEAGREYIAGVHFVRAEDNQGYRVVYKAKHALGDNSAYYFFSEDAATRSRGGSVGPLTPADADKFRANMTPNSLLGFDATCGIRQSFGQALKNARKLTLRKKPQKVDGQPCLVVEATGIKDAEWTADVKAWIDTGRDFRPLKVEVFIRTGSKRRLFRRIHDIKLKELDGVWFPVEGKRDTFTTKWAYFSAPSVPTRRLLVDVNSLKINSGIESEKFTVKFPPGCKVRDELRQTEYVVPSPKSDMKENGGPVAVDLSALRQFAPRQLIENLYPETLVGSSLPNLTDIGIDAAPEELKDRSVLVCFWDINQRPSRHVMTRLAERAGELKEKGIAVLTVQVSSAGRQGPDQAAEEYGLPFPTARIKDDEKTTQLKWCVKSLPWLILTDRQHTIIAEGFGLEEFDGKIKRSENNGH